MKNPEAQQDVSVSQRIRMMFYVMKPSETSFQTLEEVPDYIRKATPFFISLMLLELVVSWIRKGKPPGNLDDALTSMSAGIVSRLPRLFFRSIELTSYVYIWENYRLISLPWDSPWTWYLTFLGVDFGYYWFHRMAHGKNVLLWKGKWRSKELSKSLGISWGGCCCCCFTSLFCIHVEFSYVKETMIKNLPAMGQTWYHLASHSLYCLSSPHSSLLFLSSYGRTACAEMQTLRLGVGHGKGLFETSKYLPHSLCFYFYSTCKLLNSFSIYLFLYLKKVIPGWGRSLGEGNGSPVHRLCLLLFILVCKIQLTNNSVTHLYQTGHVDFDLLMLKKLPLHFKSMCINFFPLQIHTHLDNAKSPTAVGFCSM
ncbi:hypothetical protein FD754_022214 [Muntiacus muntjak]|uniref:Fatty acid hydroxylase domain-containing protein n=1 Tax=Muntiacus muntjak TaxID=9888 RepID=A0A5N3V8R3_MUNMU|nr:hypothetical protein FD754_022214 [Muntiacus muntjak]